MEQNSCSSRFKWSVETLPGKFPDFEPLVLQEYIFSFIFDEEEWQTRN